MSILERLFPRQSAAESLATAGQTRKVGGLKMVSETPGVLWGRPETAAGVAVDEYEALTISAVFAACFRLANVAAMLPVGVYQKDDAGRRTEQTSHPAARVLAVEANPNQTAFTARHFMQFWKPLFGSACAEVGWDGAGRSRYLWPLEPWRVEPVYDEAKRGELVYFRVDGTRRVEAADMVYVPHLTEDGVCGVGFVQYALESLGNAIAADRSAGRFFQNDMKPGGIISHDGSPDKKARDELREGWQRYHGGVANRGKVGVLWGGWKWIKEAGMIDPDKAQLLESRQFAVVEVARWLNVPPHWLAELGRATWANIESQSIEALIYTVAPMLAATEQEWDRKLLSPPRLYCKHNVNALLRADSKTRAEFYGKMKEIGVYTTNMILAYEDENGIGPDGDRRFVPMNWQPADDLETGAEARKAVADAKQTPAPPAGSTGNGAPAVGNDVPPEANSVPSPGALQPSPLPPAPAPAPSADVLEALRAVAEQVIRGLAKKEINEATRAAKRPKEVMAWMDGFYPDFGLLLKDSLVATARLTLASAGPELNRGHMPGTLAAKWANDWVDASRAELLAAMECRAEEWPHKSAALLKSWETRPAAAAEAIADLVAKGQ